MIILRMMWWTVCLWCWKWARHDMGVRHPDYVEALHGILKYEELLGLRRRRRLEGPQHWNCRCVPRPLVYVKDGGTYNGSTIAAYVSGGDE